MSALHNHFTNTYVNHQLLLNPFQIRERVHWVFKIGEFHRSVLE